MKDEKDWSKATDEERLKKAESYIGCKARCLHSNEIIDIAEFDEVWQSGTIWMKGNGKLGFVSMIVYMAGKWAEIISEPKEASHEAQKEFEENNPGMIFKPEPKAGDMVEWSIHGDKGWSLAEYHGKTKGGKHVVSSAEVAAVVDHVRLPQKSEVESKANEFYDKWNLPPYTTTRQVIIEAIKWGQQNPDKK